MDQRTPLLFPLLLTLLSALVAAPARAEGALPGSEIVLERSAGDLPVVRIHGPERELRFAIDTGTSRTLVSARVATLLGLQPIQRIRVASATGQNQDGLCGTHPPLSLAGADLDLECIAWLPEEQVLSGSPDVDGLLGADALAGLDLWLDLANARARVAPAGSLVTWTDGAHLPLELIARKPAIRGSFGRGPGRRSVLRLVLDSGANATVLFGAPARQIAESSSRYLQSGRVETPTGGRDVRIASLGDLRSGPDRLENGWTVLLPEVGDRDEDGLLPLGALGPVLISVSERVVVRDAALRRTPRDPAPTEVLVAGRRPQR